MVQYSIELPRSMVMLFAFPSSLSENLEKDADER